MLLCLNEKTVKTNPVKKQGMNNVHSIFWVKRRDNNQYMYWYIYIHTYMYARTYSLRTYNLIKMFLRGY